MRIKIAIFEPNFLTSRPLAGSSTVLLQNQVRYFAKLGAEIIVLAEEWMSNIPMSIENGYSICKLRGKLTHLRSLFLLTDQLIPIPPPVFSLDTIFQVARILKNSDIDVIYSCGTPFSSIFTALLGHMTGIPTIHYVFHTTSKRWWKAAIMEDYDMPLSYVLSNFVKNVLQALPRRDFLIKWGLKNITKVIASSAFVRNTLHERCLDKNDVPVVYPSVKLPATSQASKETDVPIITYFGNLWWGRGALDIVKAFCHVLKRHPEAKLMLATTNIHTITQLYFNEMASKHNLNSNIVLRGIVEDVYMDVLAPSTVVVLPYREASSIKLIEAMASAKPVITTNVEWNPELIVDGFNGFLTDVGDIYGIANKIEAFLNNPRLAEEIGKNARRTVKAKCNLENNTKAILNLLVEAKQRG